MSDLPEIMTASEVATMLRLSPKAGYQTIYKWAREGKITAFKVGDLWRFRRESVMRFLEAGRVR